MAEQALACSLVVIPLAVEALEIDYLITLVEEHVSQGESLVEIASRVVPQVENHTGHALGEQLGSSEQDFLVGVARELGKAQIAGAVVHHEGGVHAMHRNLAPGYVEGDFLPVAEHGDLHLGAGRALHPPDHAVLRELHARNGNVVDVHQPVPLKHSRLLCRTAGDDLQHYGRIVRDVELYAYSVEIAGKFRLGSLKFLRLKVYGMGVQLG